MAYRGARFARRSTVRLGTPVLAHPLPMYTFPPEDPSCFLHFAIRSGGFLRVHCFRRTNAGVLSPLFFLAFSRVPLPPQAASASAASAPAGETGKFRLHKFEQAIGEETYSITREGGSLTLKSDFAFSDRSTKVPLAATLKTSDDYSPQSFTIQGKTSRMSGIDSSVEISGSSATIRQGRGQGDNKNARTVAVPQTFFTIAGYAPVAMQMALIRYWRAHGSPAHLSTLPSGEVQIQDRGSESIDVDNRRVQVERFTVRGLIWGMETLWVARH